MCHATVELKKWGNSLGIIIPKDKIDELGLSEHDIIDIDIMKKEKILYIVFFPKILFLIINSDFFRSTAPLSPFLSV